MQDISFYLIHNNSCDRIYIRSRLKNLSNNLNIDLIEIYKQRNNFKKKITFKDKFKILIIYFLRILYNLKHKKELSFNFGFFKLKSFFYFINSSIKLFLKNKDDSLKTYQHIKIEELVTQKHIRAWKHFLKSKKEIMVIFEDDAICKTDSEIRLKDFFNQLSSIDFDNFFIDFAGGLDPNDVIPKTKIKKLNYQFMIVKGIYTNTACSYLINRNLVKKLYMEYQRSKLNPSFPIDHLINKLGLTINKTTNIFSIHFHKPLFTHGSFKGNIKSWQV